jgi:hypothetical protein
MGKNKGFRMKGIKKLWGLWHKREASFATPGEKSFDTPGSRQKNILIISLIVLHILPIWIFKYFPYTCQQWLQFFGFQRAEIHH